MIQKNNKKDFLLLVLFTILIFRPIAEAFSEIKYISPLLSPLYLSAGLLLILFIIGSIKKFSVLSLRINSFFIFGFIVAVCSLLIFLNDPGLNSLSNSLKFLYPIFGFFFFFFYFRLEEDYHSLFYVLALSTIIPLLFIVFEIIIGPIDPYIPGGRSIVRYRGPYPDGANYTIYWLFSLLLVIYFFLKEDARKLPAWGMYLVIPVITVALFYLSQAAAYLTFAILLITALVFIGFKNYLHSLALLLIVLALVISFYQVKFISSAESLFSNEMNIIGGDRSIESGLNGRINIWIKDWQHFKQLSLSGILFGVPFAGDNFYRGIGDGSHNDFIRILISTGIIGLALYLYILWIFLKKTLKLQPPEKFLGLGLFIITIMLSVSLTPTYYIPFLNFAIPISVFLWKKEYLIK